MAKKKDKDDLRAGNKHGKRSKPLPEKKPVYHHGSTTQGGSDLEGSSNMGSDDYRQGDAANRGSNYEGERWVSDDANNEPPPPPEK